LLIVGGTMSRGTSRTVSVDGRYWISSNTSVRKMTAPGVVARSSPTENASGSTIEGTRGGVARSLTNWVRPRTALRPPVSMAALSDSGLTTGTLLGARASTRLVALNRMRSSSCQSRSASSISSQAVRAAARCVCIARLSSGLPVQAGSLNRLSFLLGVSSELPAAMRASSRASSPARPATAPGRRASADPNRNAVPAGGTSLRSGPRAASTSTMSSGRPTSAAPSGPGPSDGAFPAAASAGFVRDCFFGRVESDAGWAIGDLLYSAALRIRARGEERAPPPGAV
jgi:hypothetical protein